MTIFIRKIAKKMMKFYSKLGDSEENQGCNNNESDACSDNDPSVHDSELLGDRMIFYL